MREQFVITMKDGRIIKIDWDNKMNMNLYHWFHKFNNGQYADDTTITYKEYHIINGGITVEDVKLTLSMDTVQSITKENVAVCFADREPFEFEKRRGL